MALKLCYVIILKSRRMKKCVVFSPSNGSKKIGTKKVKIKNFK